MRPASMLHRMGRVALILATLVGLPALTGSAADGGPTPLGVVTLDPPPDGPSAPAVGALWDQLDPAGGTSYVVSQDFGSALNGFDSLGGDDFFVSDSGGVKAWEITQVEVRGHYVNFAGTVVASSEAVYIRFYSDLNGLPGPLLYVNQLTPTGPSNTSGNFAVPLSQPFFLASNTTYWLSVQSKKLGYSPSDGEWVWSERKTAGGNRAAAWENPGRELIPACSTWRVLSDCYPGTGPDLTFLITGNTRADLYPAPILVSLTPAAAAGQAITLLIYGANFAPQGTGLTVALGSMDLTGNATVLDSSRISVSIPIELLSGHATNETANVTVTNPGGTCLGGPCTSNALTFTFVNKLFLPATAKQ